MVKNARSRHLLRLGGFLLTAIVLLPAGARANDDATYDVVPAETRRRFVERLNLYLEYERENKTDELLTLYTAETLCSLCKGSRECEEDCGPPMVLDDRDVEERTRVSLRVLEVRSARYYAGEIEVVLEEVQRIKWKGDPAELVTSKVRVYGAFERGDWYFTLVAIDGEVML